ncbi:MAG: Flp pilus assembly complex ATPase component TadA [Methyloprofundus sp.]|nr:Flp pilus assembly complex ATPase component TadA [Methyloprofundus sp.]
MSGFKSIRVQDFNDLPFFEVVLSDESEGRSFIPLFGEAKEHCALIARVMGGGDLSWSGVVSGEQLIEVNIVFTDLFSNSNFGFTSSLVKRLESFKGVNIGSQVIVPDSVLKQIQLSKKGGSQDYKKLKKEEVISQKADAQKFFDMVCQEGIRQGASDIHFSTVDGKAYVRFRVGGKIKLFTNSTPENILQVLSSAYNSLADKASRSGNFSENAYQNCLIEREYEGLGHFRFRYASAPTEAGIYCVLRILIVSAGDNQKTKKLIELGGTNSHASIVRKMVSNPTGLYLVAGTTGSGKSTTLKNLIQSEIEANPTKNFCTIEEPIEYRIVGANQIPVKRSANDTVEKNGFTEAIKAVMRLDPDSILIGEIRDKDTAKLAGSATESGHFVFSTVHAQSAMDIFSRLSGDTMQMSLDQICSPGFIAGLTYQKLIPVLCEHCKEPFKPKFEEYRHSDDVEKKLFIDRFLNVFKEEEVDYLFTTNKSGCSHCNGGEKGQEIAMEAIIPDYEMLSLVKKKDFIAAYKHWRTMRVTDPENFTGKTVLDHVLYKVRKGYVDPIEVEDRFGDLDKEFLLEDGVLDGSELGYADDSGVIKHSNREKFDFNFKENGAS